MILETLAVDIPIILLILGKKKHANLPVVRYAAERGLIQRLYGQREEKTVAIDPGQAHDHDIC